ncbi:MAG: NAD-dependent epimerase/dehydratase family protein [Caldilineaceae bacterium]|nr:NAD-dependent epimerase/dehydratase family protein [Caldilineaceae bacterium]
MQLLITGGDCALARQTLDQLGAAFQLRVVDTHFSAPLPANVEQRTGDLRDEQFLSAILSGVEAVLHFAPLSLTLASDLENLDHTLLGSYRLAHAARQQQVSRIVLASSMALFATAPQQWPIVENWRPRPQPHLADLCAWLGECCLREVARDGGTPTVCVRFGTLDERVIATIQQAFVARCAGWRILHASQQSPVAPLLPPAAIPARPIRKIVVFGAGGPMAAAAVQELAPYYQVRVSDVKSIADIIAAGPRKDQRPDVPMPIPLGPPHDEQVVDITNAAQVMAACEGMDAIINCTVIRHDVVGSFRVNANGAYNVMQAAVAHGIQRVVHTGPFQLGMDGPIGYSWDHWIVDDVPQRPGHAMNTYLHTKYLGQEIARIFAEHYQLVVPSLFFCDFADFVNLRQRNDSVHPFTTTWTDTARSIRAAVETTAMPSPFEVLHVNSDMPQGVFPNEKAKRILGWQPQDPTASWWQSNR